jgi:iduronate 2-sulfatase
MSQVCRIFSLVVILSTGWAGEVKNVLFLVSDDLRANALGCYGDKFCQTPHIDKLARSGMLFERAYCQGTVCGPSRTSFMYSRYRGSDNITLGQHFKDNGFHSARVASLRAPTAPTSRPVGRRSSTRRARRRTHPAITPAST